MWHTDNNRRDVHNAEAALRSDNVCVRHHVSRWM
jgi:hypothetical protein